MAMIKDRKNFKELFLAIVAIIIVVAGVVSWFSYQTYESEKERIKNLLSIEAKTISRGFGDYVSHTATVMQIIADQIKQDPEDLEYVDYNLTKLRPSHEILDNLTWTIFSWVNPEKQMVVDTVYKIVNPPIDLSDRDYLDDTAKDPGKIHLGNPVYGSTSQKWMIPAGIGVQDEKGKFVGTITVGFDAANIANKFRSLIKQSGMNFILVTANTEHVLGSLEDSASKNENIKLALNELISTKQNSYYHIDLKDKIDNYVLHKIPNSPYYIYVEYDREIIFHDLRQKIISKIQEICTISLLAILFIIYNYWREKTRFAAAIRADQQEKVNMLLEKKVLERTKKLTKALEVKNEFLNNVSHEIRTPIQSVTAFISTLAEQWGNIDDQQKYDIVIKAKSSADRLFKFVGDILDFSTISSGKTKLHIEKNDLNIIAKDVIAEFEPLLSKTALAIELQHNMAQCVTMCDKAKIAQVIRNLLANAIKFSHSGAIIFNIDQQGEFIKCSVIDEAIGIPEMELENIFGAFNQSSKTKTAAGGKGLGLSIAKEIILQHNGNIWAENNEKGGASFHFTINSFEKPRYEKSLDLLMIDDEVSCLEMMKVMMIGTEHHLTVKEGGIEGLEYLESKEKLPDVILLDLMMPDIHGFEVLKKLRANPRYDGVRIIIQSGIASENELEQAKLLGADDFIRKPYKKAEMLEVVGG